MLWRAPLELLGTAPDVVIAVPWIRFWGLERNLKSFRDVRFEIFREDGIVSLDILASGVPADFRQPSRSAFQPQVRSTSLNTSLSLVEAFT